ncbi:hypothetical protein RD149_23040 [Gordonia westfalica]|uniref:Uncharacterized protein n=1 Tax=Gordonia westfalica TaxID=158898 RepID=A0ABU2GYU3_9ACTN|nr:hypothetical protein [Gordonia westfalica]MDS1116628.1 hypothetical protein [Gordonia westfalica]
MKNSNLTGYGLALGGSLVCVGGASHPHGPMDSVEGHVIGMLEDPTWVPTHSIAMLGTALIAASLIGLVRSGVRPAQVAPFLMVAAVGAVLATIEYIPHIAAKLELDALKAGEPAPITRTHEVLAAYSGPVFGFGSALLALVVAITATRRRSLWALVAIPGVVGGVAGGLAVPLLLVTRDVQMTLLFPGVAGVAVFYILLGIGVARGAAPSTPEPDEARTEDLPTPTGSPVPAPA